MINEPFINRIAPERRREFSLGKYYHTDFDELEKLGGTTVVVATGLDQKLCGKFRLKKTDFRRQLTEDRKKWEEEADEVDRAAINRENRDKLDSAAKPGQ